MNRVQVTGRLTRDPDLRELPDGKAVVGVRLAVDGMARGNETGFVDVVAFGKAAEAAARILSTGWLVAVDGRLEWRTWEADGVTRTAYAIVGNIEFLAAPKPKTSAVDAAVEHASAPPAREPVPA